METPRDMKEWINSSLWERSIYLYWGPIGDNELETLLPRTLRERRGFLSGKFVDWELRGSEKEGSVYGHISITTLLGTWWVHRLAGTWTDDGGLRKWSFSLHGCFVRGTWRKSSFSRDYEWYVEKGSCIGHLYPKSLVGEPGEGTCLLDNLRDQRRGLWKWSFLLYGNSAKNMEGNLFAG